MFFPFMETRPHNSACVVSVWVNRTCPAVQLHQNYFQSKFKLGLLMLWKLCVFGNIEAALKLYRNQVGLYIATDVQAAFLFCNIIFLVLYTSYIDIVQSFTHVSSFQRSTCPQADLLYKEIKNKQTGIHVK